MQHKVKRRNQYPSAYMCIHIRIQYMCIYPDVKTDSRGAEPPVMQPTPPPPKHVAYSRYCVWQQLNYGTCLGHSPSGHVITAEPTTQPTYLSWWFSSSFASDSPSAFTVSFSTDSYVDRALWRILCRLCGSSLPSPLQPISPSRFPGLDPPR